MALTGNEIEQLKDIIDKFSLSENLTQSQIYSLYYMSNVNNFSINFARKLFDDNFNPYPNIKYYNDSRFLYLRRKLNQIFYQIHIENIYFIHKLKNFLLENGENYYNDNNPPETFNQFIQIFKNDFIIYYKSKYPSHYNLDSWFYNWFIPNSFQINIVAEYLSLIDLPFFK